MSPPSPRLASFPRTLAAAIVMAVAYFALAAFCESFDRLTLQRPLPYETPAATLCAWLFPLFCTTLAGQGALWLGAVLHHFRTGPRPLALVLLAVGRALAWLMVILALIALVAFNLFDPELA